MLIKNLDNNLKNIIENDEIIPILIILILPLKNYLNLK